MQPKHVYLVLCMIGAIVPYTLFLPFLLEHGPDLVFFTELLFVNPIAGAFGLDMILSSVVFWMLVAVEGRRAGVRHLWAPIAANIVIGLSMGLPLFLYMRELHLERGTPA